MRRTPRSRAAPHATLSRGAGSDSARAAQCTPRRPRSETRISLATRRALASTLARQACSRCKHTSMHSRTRTHKCTHTHGRPSMRAQALTHKRKSAQAHSRPHVRAHTHTHARARARPRTRPREFLASRLGKGKPGPAASSLSSKYRAYPSRYPGQVDQDPCPLLAARAEGGSWPTLSTATL